MFFCRQSAIALHQRDQDDDPHLQEVSSGGFEVGRAQLIRPSQKRSFRTHVRLEEEQRLQGGMCQILKISNQRESTSKPITSSIIRDIISKPISSSPVDRIVLAAGLLEPSHSQGERLVPGPVGGWHRKLQKEDSIFTFICNLTITLSMSNNFNKINKKQTCIQMSIS